MLRSKSSGHVTDSDAKAGANGKSATAASKPAPFLRTNSSGSVTEKRAKMAFLKRAIARRKMKPKTAAHGDTPGGSTPKSDADGRRTGGASSPAQPQGQPTVVHTPDGDIVIPYFPCDASSPVSVQLMASAGVNLSASISSPADVPRTMPAPAAVPSPSPSQAPGGGVRGVAAAIAAAATSSMSPLQRHIHTSKVAAAVGGASITRVAASPGTPTTPRSARSPSSLVVGASASPASHATASPRGDDAVTRTAVEVVPSPRAQQRHALAQKLRRAAAAAVGSPRLARVHLQAAGGGRMAKAAQAVLRMAQLDTEEHQLRLEMAQAESLLAHVQAQVVDAMERAAREEEEEKKRAEAMARGQPSPTRSSGPRLGRSSSKVRELVCLVLCVASCSLGYGHILTSRAFPHACFLPLCLQVPMDMAWTPSAQPRQLLIPQLDDADQHLAELATELAELEREEEAWALDTEHKFAAVKQEEDAFADAVRTAVLLPWHMRQCECGVTSIVTVYRPRRLPSKRSPTPRPCVSSWRPPCSCSNAKPQHARSWRRPKLPSPLQATPRPSRTRG